METLLVVEFLFGLVVGAVLVDYLMAKTEARRYRRWKRRNQ